MYYPRLKDLKEDKDLKQINIAQIIKVSENQYGRYERGENDIPLEKALILSDFYNVSLDYIAGRTNDKKGLTRSELSEEETEMIKKYRSFTERHKGRIEQLFEELAKSEKDEAIKKEA